MLKMSITRKWTHWEWIVTDRTGKIITFGVALSRTAARHRAANALFHHLLAPGNRYELPPRSRKA